MMAPLGWAFAGIVVISPVVFSFARVRQATDLKNFLYIRHSFFFLVFGVLALLQSTSFSSWWFWRWIADAELVSSNFILGACLLGTAYAAFTAVCVFAVDIYFRNTRALAREFFWDENPDVPLIVKIKRALVLSGRFYRLVFMPLVVLAVVSTVIIGRVNPTEVRAKAIVNDYVANVVRECSDTPVLITDGALDGLIELRAAIEGTDLKTLSIMSGNSGYEAAIRKRVDVENKYSNELTAGTADALRSWMRDDSPMISNLAVQVGFELWRMNNKNFPQCGGFLGKSGESDDFDTQKGINAAHSLAEEILSFREECDISDVESLKLRSALSRIQWRLSRMCGIRAYIANRAKDGALAEKENNLAERLDEANPEYKKVKAIGDEILQKNTTLTLTPREGLNISLRRADFKLAGSYAKKVILQDENDVSANFALGMDYFTNHRYDKAEEYLKRALKNSPDEPAILNNLAVVLIRMDRYDEAETNALKALKILPESKEVQETLRRIRELKSKEK
ncbi:MAG: tetratricopeptide repeat protein [Kiritimatiellae bacterium]|nr:tetratricopeptide repeat protein [Kiritimatiellia bacterium]